MSQNYEKLKLLLKELFQLDQPDLDFGLYRIMHAKSGEVAQFLEKDLLPQVEAAFGLYKAADKTEIEKELATAIAQATGLGIDPETTQKVKDLRARLKSDAVDLGALESEVYDHLYSFFRRYYTEGDFLSTRVYKSDTYAIPYEGEEVTLHWANADQYYIKTSEYLRDYSFRLRPDNNEKPLRVHFRLVDAAEGEHDNVKAAEGSDRVFILAAPGDSGRDFVREEDTTQAKELVIRFEYRPATLADWPEAARDAKSKPPLQKELTALANRRVLAVADVSLAEWLAELGKPHILSSGEKADYSRLEAHLRRYTARNTFDYFIHQNLGGFLRRELDFYIKNEVMHLDDVEDQSAPRVEQYLSKIRIIRRIARKLIDFLTQLEDFQKKLWLKKKFVVESSWCIRVGCIPEEFYPDIAANGAQCEEWVKFFAIDEIKGDVTTPGFSAPLDPAFLKAHPTLVLDTCHFDSEFTDRLVEAMGDVEEQTDGLLFHSENFQALSLIQTKYRDRVRCIYIDPPYNTGNDGFAYKDNYRHSSWLAMLEGRIELARSLMPRDSALFVSIDDGEQGVLRQLLDSTFGPTNFVANVIWRKKYAPQNDAKWFSDDHDFLLLYARDKAAWHPAKLQRTEGQNQLYSNPDNDPRGPWMSDNYTCNKSADERPNLYYAIVNPVTGQEVWPRRERVWGYDRNAHRKHVDEDRLWWGLEGENSTPRLKRFLSDVGGIVPRTVWGYDEVGHNQDAIRELDALFGRRPFINPKPTGLIARVVLLAPAEQILDFYAGSGTTGHAVINLNRDDDGRRKFMLVEMADYFDTVLLPRIKKATFAPEWSDGKPKRHATAKEAERSPRIVRVVRLESYEDTLNNLETRRTHAQQLLLDSADTQGADGLREQYILRYMLDVETRGNQSLLNTLAFSDPTAYQLKVKRPGSDETRAVNVDLLETFNWLVGLTVRHIAAPQSFSVTFERDSEKRLRLKGRPKLDANGRWWFRTVTGTTPDGRRTIVIWRKLTGEPEQDNLVLDEWFTKQGYSSKDSEFDLIYVNGGNNLENLKAPDDTWKVRLIEEDFHRLMFESEGA